MNRFGKIALMVFLSVVVLGSIAWAKPRVAVMDFENKAQYGGWRIGQGAADILTTELVKMGNLDMYEREKLNAVLKEQNLGASGRVNPSTAAKIGKIIGVDYIITGAVTEYGQSRGGGGGRGVNVGKVGYHASVDVRMVDATTGKIVFADTGSQSRSSFNVRVFGIGGGESFNEKLATEAMRGAIQEVSQKLAAVDLKSVAPGPKKAQKKSDNRVLIADVDGASLILNKGSNAGLKSGQTLTVKRKGKEIKDPASGKVLKVRYNTIGKIKLTAVEGSYSEATVVSGSGFQVGDIVQ